jgi:hypothetical protein
MSAAAALRHLTRRPEDPESGWLTPDRIRAAIAEIYQDIERSAVPQVEERIILAPPIGRSSHVSMLPQIVPEDGWVVIEHGMNSEDVLVQASANGLVLPMEIRIMGPNSVAVHVQEPVHQLTKVVVLR